VFEESKSREVSSDAPAVAFGSSGGVQQNSLAIEQGNRSGVVENRFVVQAFRLR
jgi:hypothetical protein